VAAKDIIKPERVKQLAEIKRIHNLSNGSAGARMVATMATTEGFPIQVSLDKPKLKVK